MSTKLAATYPMPTGLPSPGCSKRRDSIQMNCLPAWEHSLRRKLKVTFSGGEGGVGKAQFYSDSSRPGPRLVQFMQMRNPNLQVELAFNFFFFFFKKATSVKRSEATCNNLRHHCRGLGFLTNRRMCVHTEESQQLTSITRTSASYSAIFPLLVMFQSQCLEIEKKKKKRMVGYSLCSSSMQCAP